MKKNVPLLALAGAFVLSFVSGFSTSAQSIDFGKSYVNITKGLNGGTVEPGDTLEIRAAFVVRSGTYDSCAFYDAIPAGTSYIRNTIRVLTNEGKVYKQFTDAAGDDQGWRSGNNITIHLGFNPGAAPATASKRGRVANTHRPSFYGSTCIMIASFRVRVTAALGSIINTGDGHVTYKNGRSAIQSFTFPSNPVAIYTNYGMCSNAVGVNALGTEYNGSFGVGTTQHRGISTNVPAGYTYATFSANGPNDYYYSIANNTSNSANLTTSNAWPVPDNSSPTHRVFTVWDIIGDHTGAADPYKGNAPAGNGANGGYMLVINAAYRIDSAFQQTISNLCPNTYYEISCWMRNICSRCGCDSAGRGSGSSGYIPTAPGDSSGVHPNLTFEIDGIDYYTSGNISYSGEWVKKGFTFKTGPTQTSFTLKFMNNAPGGGGNDWVLDDISVATCSPNLAFTPSNNPSVCANNTIDLGSYVRSYFDNYTEYKWQKSTDNGLTWTNTGVAGTGTPAWNGTAWEYFTAFPTFIVTPADSGTKFRVVVASTPANLNNTNCAFADVASVLTLNVLNCGAPLQTGFLSFSGTLGGDNTARLVWTTDFGAAAQAYVVEKSVDGKQFAQAAVLSAGMQPKGIKERFSWSESFMRPAYYRIKATADGATYLSKTVWISGNAASTHFVQVSNPFEGSVYTEIFTATAKNIQLQLIDNFGRIVKSQQFKTAAGINRVVLQNTAHVPAGMYVLQLSDDMMLENKRLIKY